MMNLFKPLQPRYSRARAACGCHVGKRRKNNEDNFFFHGSSLECDNMGTARILELDAARWERDGCFFAVFDGMGGGDYGEVASYTAAREARRFFVEQDQMDPHDVSLSLERYCMEASEQVFRAGSSLGSRQMGSTVASLFFLDGRVWACNLGDSRCFLLRDGRLEQLSLDHTDEGGYASSRKPYLTQYLGIDPSEFRIEPAIKSFPVKLGDSFLVCSDGLTDMVSTSDITEALLGCDRPEDAVEALIQAALDAGGRDNITVIVCQC